MSIQPDSWIKKMCKEQNMIDPFLDHQVSDGKISYGLSSMGYDVRISDEYIIFTNVNNSIVDPKNFSEENFVSKKGDHCIIPPNSFVTKFVGLKFFGSTISELTLVNILNSSDTLASYP